VVLTLSALFLEFDVLLFGAFVFFGGGALDFESGGTDGGGQHVDSDAIWGWGFEGVNGRHGSEIH
jgi:hypothetical protein